MIADWPVFHLGIIDSTNSEAGRRARSGSFDDCWLVAEAQTAGRGRLQRTWHSPKGNLFSTALYHEPAGIAVALRMPFAAALAVSDAIVACAPDANVKVKWPNDVRVHRAKISGILIETGQLAQGVWVAAGMGINVAECPPDSGQSATSIAIERGDREVTADQVLTELRKAFAARLAQARQGFGQLRTDWLARAEGLGEVAKGTVSGESVEGVFEEIDADGGLVLRLHDGSRRTIRAGDVELVRRT